MYGSNGPVWYRGWATDSDEKVCAEVDDVLARTGTRRMVMGHTPDFKVCRPLIFRAGYLPMGFSQNIVSRCGGKIIIIDTGKLNFEVIC